MPEPYQFFPPNSVGWTVYVSNTDPATTYPDQMAKWVRWLKVNTDTLASVIDEDDVIGYYIRNEANSGWITIFERAELLDGADFVLATLLGAVNGVATLDAGGKVPTSQLPSTITGAVEYQGTWNANTNSPNLGGLTPNKGDYYVVSTAGTTSLGGITDWAIGDWAIYNGAAWQKVDNSEAVTSVAGRTGTIVLVVADLSDATAAGLALLTAANAAAQLAALGAVAAADLSWMNNIAQATLSADQSHDDGGGGGQAFTMSWAGLQAKSASGMFSGGSPTRLTALAEGWHEVTLNVETDPGTFDVLFAITANGSVQVAGWTGDSGGGFVQFSISGKVYLLAGEYVEAPGFVFSGTVVVEDNRSDFTLKQITAAIP